MDRIKLALAYPYEVTRFVDDEQRTVIISELALAPRIKGRHMKAADQAKGPVEAQLAVIASLANIGREEALELDEADLDAIDAAVHGREADMRRVASALQLPPNATVDTMLAAIAALHDGGRASGDRQPPLSEPETSAPGQETGGTS